MRARGRLLWLRGLLVGLAVTAAAVPAVYWLGVTLRPPVTSEGHGVMPLAQVAVALALAPLLGTIAGVLAARAGRR
jgi:hypothetical protein